MDRLTVAFGGRLFVSLALAFIGFMAVQYGYNLFVSGVGLKKDKGKLRFRAPQIKVEVVTSSVGGVLMLTSLGWGILTYLSLPTLSPDRVASTDAIIKALVLGEVTELTPADKAAITDFVQRAEQPLETRLSAKRLELLREVVPQASRIAVLLDMNDPSSTAQWKELETAAQSRSLQLQLLDVRKPEGLAPAFDTATKQRADALVVGSDPLTYANRTAIVELARKHRLPAIYPSTAFAVVGGLMAYGISYPDLYRRLAMSADRIFKNERPNGLSEQAPIKAELTVNLATAKALGLDLPQTVVTRADEVIE